MTTYSFVRISGVTARKAGECVDALDYLADQYVRPNSFKFQPHCTLLPECAMQKLTAPLTLGLGTLKAYVLNIQLVTLFVSCCNAMVFLKGSQLHKRRTVHTHLAAGNIVPLSFDSCRDKWLRAIIENILHTIQVDR